MDFWAKKWGCIQESPQKVDFSKTWGSIQEWGCIQADTVGRCIYTATAYYYKHISLADIQINYNYDLAEISKLTCNY